MSYFNLESDRLQFRKLNVEDIESWQAFFVDNPNINYLGIDVSKSKEELAGEWIRMQFSRYLTIGLGHLAVINKDTNEFIGMGGIIPRDINGHEEYEIAFSIFQRFWRKGYGTEIAQTLRKYGEEHIDCKRFISIIHVDNIGSQGVAKNNGMKVSERTMYLGMEVDIYGT